MPGLLKSPAFGVGAFKAINVRYDRMAENAEKYKEAARVRGAELFAEHKATKSRLKVENEAKVMIAGDFSPALADYLDSKGMINFIAGQAPDKFFELMDQKASEVQAKGGIPEGFTANENMYYGEQRFEDVTTSYNKVKDFIDTQNNVFGNSFGMLMEENTPEKMTKEQFGVREREDIVSLGRSGLGAQEIKSEDEKRVFDIVEEFGGWQKEMIGKDAQGELIVDYKGFTLSIVSAAKKFASQHYRYNPDRSTQGGATSAQQGVAVAKYIQYQAGKDDSLEAAQADLKNIYTYLKDTLPVFGTNAQETRRIFSDAVNLYILSAAQSGSIIEGRDLREWAEQDLKIFADYGIKITPTL